MEIRAVRENELQEMIDLQCRIFRPDGQERFHQYIHGDSSYRLDQTRVVLVDGRIVATLRVWDREMRVGSTPMKMAGIGGVGTHPDHRRKGYAAAMMRDVSEWFGANGYQLGLLFTEIPCRYYAQFGWAGVPMQGFSIVPGRFDNAHDHEGWTVERYKDERDLEQAVSLYAAYNQMQSGSIVRRRAHWDTAPARIRDLLPTIVARRGDVLGGYMTYHLAGPSAKVLEVAHDRSDRRILQSLVDQLVRDCGSQGVNKIDGEITHRHPLVELLVETTGGDLALTGRNSMMAYAVDLPAIFRCLLPELQSRLDNSRERPPPMAICFEVGDDHCTLAIDDAGRLQISPTRKGAVSLPLPDSIFWRALFGESSWSQLEPTLAALGLEPPANVSTLINALLPGREVIFWAPDHF